MSNNLLDTPEGLISAVRKIMTQNQNLYQQDLEKRYTEYTEQPVEGETTRDEIVDVEELTGEVDDE